MNEQQVINKLLNGLYHRPYSTVLEPHVVEQLAKAHNVRVEIMQYKAQDSAIKCVFEVKP